ncbi:hypothetical protein QR680_003154 [Steinernema hermaphroditum]|uniref:RRM domain-containing protein n=1 Tax=Steinernema hermaphroditum TaxID=289476 RepID=A0AA39H5K9_9BILA|nr:hypothetical protein QR680_003154 [Steinernema hermaphroditum]
MYLFKPFGEIAECENIIDKKTGKSKGFAVITFVFPENAAAAYAALDGSVFKGRMLHLLPGDEKRDDKALDPSNQKGLSAFQKEKQAKLKASAGKAHSWHALFLGANAVADTLANKLAVSKADLLTGDDESSADVWLALAETRLVRETREFLLQHGVKLDAFSRPATKRSDTVIIVKNLPANRDDEELKRMFGRFGDLKQFIMPPEGGVSAIVEMGNSVDAKKAFASLAYSRFRNQPLYLEWAPLDVFADRKEETKPSGSGQRKIKTEPKVEIKEEMVEAEEPEQEAEGTEPVEEVGATLFVKNLNFDTTDNTLEKHFSERWPVVKATGELLDGHAIEVKLSHREEQKDETVTRKRVSNLEQGDCTNIMVRNIPFQAVKKEITQLFSAFGQLKRVRLPKRVRLSAVVEVTVVLVSTPLRRLVLEWAKADDSVEDLRERTKEKFSGEKGFKKKKERLDAIKRKVAELIELL